MIIHILTRPLKQRNQLRLENHGIQNTAMDNETQAVASGDNPWFIGGLSNGMRSPENGRNSKKYYAVGIMLEGYYDMARRGVWMAASGRPIATLTLLLYIIRTYRRRGI
jgi:hypothetical protein